MAISIAKKLLSKVQVQKAEKSAYNARKTYLLEIDTRVGPKESCKKIQVWQPIPVNVDYQKRIRIEFPHLEPKIVKENLHGNRVAYWTVEAPKTNKEYRFSQKTKVWVDPRTKEKTTGGLGDYNHNSEEYKLYTRNEPHFSFSGSRIKSLAVKLSSGKKEVRDIAKGFYNWVRDNLVYGDPIPGLYSSKEALDLDKVDCGGFDSLLGALLRSVGIPSRLLSGHLADYEQNHMHAWLEYMTPTGIWIPVDPSMEHLKMRGRGFKPGGFEMVGNDRILFSIGSDVKVGGKNFSIIQMPIVESVPDDTVSVSQTIAIQKIK